jgi:cytochrome c peroxidase
MKSFLWAALVFTGSWSQCQEIVDGAEEVPALKSLKLVPVQRPSNLQEFITDEQAALVLGKALFWDMQTGSDGVTTCATCHYHAGSDTRHVNSVSPAQLHAGRTDGSMILRRGVNAKLNLRDFPFHRLADANNRHSSVLSDSDNIVGSQGVLLEAFRHVQPRGGDEARVLIPDAVFSKSGTNTRRVTPRNSPSVINAVFNLRNFWDGRAQDVFNGVNVFGQRDAGARVMRADKPSEMSPTTIRLERSSLASQAVGPPLSDLEMSADGRTFPDIGRKILGLRPLARQQVHRQDSVFSGQVHSTGRGLMHSSYLQLVRRAFHPRWWQGTQWVERHGDGTVRLISPPKAPKANQYSHASWNFALFFGLAIQTYEATLVSDDAPFDRFAEGDPQALTSQQIEGWRLFNSKGRCAACHSGPEFTNASISRSSTERIERMIFASRPPSLDAFGFVNTTGRHVVYDNGFYNIGVRPTHEDLGLGAVDPFGYPLSEARVFYQHKLGELGLPMPSFPPDSLRSPSADGSFKTPTLRNVELTAPYFHNGGTLTLRQVIDFYNRGGDFKDQNIADIPPDITELGLTAAEKDQLVAFMRALTDERVRHHKAPFDHPELLVPNGHFTDSQGGIERDSNGRALSQWIVIPASGRQGFGVLPNFLHIP